MLSHTVDAIAILALFFSFLCEAAEPRRLQGDAPARGTANLVAQN